MNFSIFGTTFFILLFSTVHGLNSECVSDVQACAISFQTAVSQIGANNNSATCLKVNEFLECLDRVLQPCDLATRTSLLDAMNNLIDSYKRPPYSCVLSFADNFTVPECTLQIGSCAAWDLQAQAAANTEVACRYHHEYVTCMNDNTTSCNYTDRMGIIDQAIRNSTSKFEPCPYNCYRLMFDGCETTTIPTTFVPTQPPTTPVDYVTDDQNTDTPRQTTVFPVSECTLQIDTCSALRMQADASTPENACRYHHEYVTCMNDNTTRCNYTDRMGIIDQAIENSTSKFGPCPYNCNGLFICETTNDVSIPPRTTTVDYVTYPSRNTTDYNGTETTTRQNIVNNGTDGPYNTTTESSVISANATTVASTHNVTTPMAGFDYNRTTTTESDYQPNNHTSDEVQSNTTTSTVETPIAQTTERTEVPSDTTTLKSEASETSTTSEEPSGVSSSTEETLNITESSSSEETTTFNYDSLGNNNASFLSISGLLLAMVVLLSSF